MEFFLTHPGRAYSRDQLLESVWGEQRYVTPRTVDVHVRRLREQIEEQPDNPRYLTTVRGFGYRFEELRVTGKIFLKLIGGPVVHAAAGAGLRWTTTPARSPRTPTSRIWCSKWPTRAGCSR